MAKPVLPTTFPGALTCAAKFELLHRDRQADSTTCACGPMQRIGEDVSEKLDYTPGIFTVERHVRGNGPAAPARRSARRRFRPR